LSKSYALTACLLMASTAEGDKSEEFVNSDYFRMFVFKVNDYLS
jgi:hypothetical protein